MHARRIEELRHDHHVAEAHDRHEARTRWVVAITASMMVGEIVVGRLTGSLALTADGWHMATHAGALGMSALAYWFARTRAKEQSFTFGTGKVYALAGYTSAIVLAMVALWMLVESGRRLWAPEAIDFGDALPVAVLGLFVNLLSVVLLHPGGDGHGHGHDHDHDHDSEHEHEHEHDSEHEHGHGHDHAKKGAVDHNLKAAYMHVMADAFTSVLAILALVGGKYAGWTVLDPLMGVVGGVVILRWGFGLCRGAAKQLLDVVPSSKLLERIREKIETLDDARVIDLHLWEVGPGRKGCIVSLIASAPRSPDAYRAVVREIAGAEHVTIEVHTCPHHGDAAGAVAPCR